MDQALPDIRGFQSADTNAVADIYAHHVLHGCASYETVPPTVAEMESRLQAVTTAGWPALVAVREGGVVGYAYAAQFRPRPAYAYACEDSIYVAPGHLGRGIGRSLLSALLDAAEAAGFRQMVAVVGGAEPASVALHQALGFEEVGRLPGLGWKHGRWLDSVYLQRALGPGTATPP
jgi:phosphinothricin acetyltransferase